MMQVIIVAGGRATRLGPLSSDRPKVLLPVGGEPFLALLLRHLRRQGARRVHLCLGHRAGAVLEFLDKRPVAELEITASVEPRPLGTAGCLRWALDALDERFLVVLGDTYGPIDLSRVEAAYRASGQPALMVVYRNRDRLERSNVRVRGGLVIEYDKTAPAGTFEHVDYGLSAIARDAVAHLERERFTDLADVLADLARRRRLAAHEVAARFYEIGSPEGYRELDRLVAEGALPGLAPALVEAAEADQHRPEDA